MKILLKSERQDCAFPKVVYNKNIIVNVYLNITLMFKMKTNLTKIKLLHLEGVGLATLALLCRWAYYKSTFKKCNATLTTCVDDWSF